MRIHMIRTVLSVIFKDENDTPRPELTMGDSLDDSAKGEIIVRHHRPRGRVTQSRAASMVVGKMNDVELWQVSICFEVVEFSLPLIHAGLIRHVSNFVPIGWVKMIFQSRQVHNIFLFIFSVRNSPLAVNRGT